MDIKNEKYFFGLDLSLNATGIAVFATDNIDMRFVECITLDVNKTSPKIKEIQKKLKFIGTELLKYKKAYNPEFIIIEKGFMRFITATARLMQVNGVVTYLFADIPQYYFAATESKKILTGKGNAEKSEVAKAVNNIYPKIKFSSEDESDACALCICWGIQQGWLK
jgi:crossover junction endodeoxyribonuclease RuvC